MTPNDDCVRASTEDGPDYCAICSAAMGEWGSHGKDIVTSLPRSWLYAMRSVV